MMDNTKISVKIANASDTEKARVVRLRTKENMNVYQIMRYTGWSYNMIIQYLKDLGIYSKKPKTKNFY